MTAHTLFVVCCFVSFLASNAFAQGRVAVSAGIAVQPATTSFEVDNTFDLNRESGQVVGKFNVGKANGPDVGVNVSVWRALAIGVAYTQFSRPTTGQLSGTYPHPFFFNQARKADTSVPDADRKERAIHLSIGTSIRNSSKKFTAFVFAGASFFLIDQPLAASVSVAEVYPYDVISTSTANTQTLSVNMVGIHAGADIAWYFSRSAGIGALVRVSQGSSEVSVDGSKPFSLDAGGAQFGGGIRFRF